MCTVSKVSKYGVFSGPYFLAFGLRYFVFGYFLRSVYKHISDQCKKAIRKITASAPITSYMSLPKRHQIINSFFKAQFIYCHLIWLCHSRGNIRNIHQLHKSYLRILCNNKQLSFNELLEKDIPVSIYVPNIQALATEMYKVNNELSTPIMKNIFPVNKHPYTLRQFQSSRRLLKTVYHGSESISNIGPKLWDLTPNRLKEIVSLKVFNQAIKKWNP